MKVSWPTDFQNVISPFGPRELLGMGYHYGVDIEAPLDTPYYAVYEAVITEIYWGGVVGWSIRYLSLDGRWLSEYHGAREGFLVSVGQQVTSGQVIAYSGDSESRSVSTGPHLHWTLYDQSTGERVDPMAWYYSQTEVKNVTREEVFWAYRYYLGRDPEGEQIVAERIATQTIEQVKNDLRSSPERREKVKSLYQRYLHEPSFDEISMYANSDFSIDQISQTFRTSEEMIQGIRQAVWDLQTKADSILKAIGELQEIAKKGGFSPTPVSQFSEEEIGWLRRIINAVKGLFGG